MAPTAIDLPAPSAIAKTLSGSLAPLDHPPHLQQLATTIMHNLRYEHDWRNLTLHFTSPITNQALPRPLISGLPPKRIYVHPDEQIAILKAEHETGDKVPQHPEREWVLPTHIAEAWSLQKFAAVFDALTPVPDAPATEAEDENDDVQEHPVGQEWRGDKRQKRLMLSTLHDDSTVVYYIVHDGIIKPRQN